MCPCCCGVAPLGALGACPGGCPHSGRQELPPTPLTPLPPAYRAGLLAAYPLLILFCYSSSGETGLNSSKVASLKLLWVPMCLGDLCRITGNYTCGKFWLGTAG